MVFKPYLFAAACVLALALVSEANGDDSCDTIEIGRRSGKPHILPTIHLPPRQEYVVVKIPSDCGLLNGLFGEVCNVGPVELEVSDYHTIVIHRIRLTGEEGTADFTIYCNLEDSEVPSKLVAVAQPVAPK